MGAADDTPDPVLQVGLDALAEELYELRCDLHLAAMGERMYADPQAEAMRRRVAELEPMVGQHLDRMLDEPGGSPGQARA